MKLREKVKSLAAVVMAGAMAAMLIPDIGTQKAEAASVCTVNLSKTYQSIDGFGGINHPEWYGDLTDNDRQIVFGNGDGQLGCTILRVFVNPDKSQWNKALPTAQYASKRGITVFASPWEPPANLAVPGSGGPSGGKLRLPKQNYGAYAQHLNDFGTYMKQNGVDLYSVSVQNEPDYATEWTAWTPDETTDFIANYGDKITSTRLMSPESFQYGNFAGSGKEYYKKILANPKAFANCDIFGTHFYGTPRSQMDFPELENCGKKLWMTEVYVPDSKVNANLWPDNLKQAESIHDALVVGGMQAYVVWPLRRDYSILYESTHSPSKRGYVFAQYSKFIRPGAKRVEVTEKPADNVLVSAYKNTDGKIAVVAVNESDTGYAQQFSLGQNIKNIDRYRTSGDENLALTKSLENSNGSFFAQLPAKSVSTFVITTDGSSAQQPDDPVITDEPDTNGYYFHDTFESSNDDWSGHGAASVTLSGRSPYKDTNALLAQERTGSWNGCEKTLGSAFKAGQSYSFSVCAAFLDSDASARVFKLSLAYKDSSGETKFANIAQASAAKGKYVQLANQSFKMPEGSDFVLYVETTEGTDNFYIDEAIGAKAGVKIDGPAPSGETTDPVIVKDTAVGDINSDGKLNIFDLVLAKRCLKNGINNDNMKKAADIDGNGSFDSSDIRYLMDFLLGKITAFPNNKPIEETTSKKYTMAEYTALAQEKVVEKEPDSSHNEQSGVSYGTVKSGSYYSTTCKRNKPYNILLPAGYSTAKKYPVLYCMHGYWENQDRMIITGNGTMYTRQIIGNAIASGEAKDMIVVFPYIYSSATQENCSAMDDANNAAYDNFINDLTVDLMPHIEKTYSVLTGRDNTAITGFSMGGRESLLIGMKKADLFGYVGAICPAPGVTGAFKWDSDSTAPHLLFITAGSNDTVVYNNPGDYHNNFTKNNVPHIWHYVNGGYHGDNSIHAHIYNFVRTIFKA